MNIQGVGMYDIPAIAPAEYQEAELISFNYAKSCKSPADKAVHFFVDDYQFNRVWNCADDYISMLRKFKYVCTPDLRVSAKRKRLKQRKRTRQREQKQTDSSIMLMQMKKNLLRGQEP